MRLLVVLGILAFSSVSYAEKLDRGKINKVIKNLNPVKVEYQGKEGVWFSVEEAESVLWLVEEKLSQALDIIDSQDIQIIALNSAKDSYKISNKSYADTAKFSLEALKVSLSYFPDLKPPEYSWYEGKTAFYIYGVLSGVVVIVGSAWVLSKIDEKD
jgi:hypothetical protein